MNYKELSNADKIAAIDTYIATLKEVRHETRYFRQPWN
jgi:hypothetical protein